MRQREIGCPSLYCLNLSAPTKDAAPTVGSATFKVPNPTKAAGGKKKQGTVQLIDVSGQRKFRDASWPEYYGRIHGLIFVIDVSEKKPVRESREILEDLLKHEQLKGKPILMQVTLSHAHSIVIVFSPFSLANKQDQDGAIDNEDDLKRKLEIDRLRAEHKIVSDPIDSGMNRLHVSFPLASSRSFARHCRRRRREWIHPFATVSHG